MQILGRFGGGVTTAGEEAAAFLPAAGLLGLETGPVLLLRMSVAGLLTGSLFLSPSPSSSLVETFSRWGNRIGRIFTPPEDPVKIK